MTERLDGCFQVPAAAGIGGVRLYLPDPSSITTGFFDLGLNSLHEAMHGALPVRRRYAVAAGDA